jgi:hypothetical protein
MEAELTRRSLSRLIALPCALLVFPALARDVAPSMTGVPPVGDRPRHGCLPHRWQGGAGHIGLSDDLA